jgi:hypothetical protein
MKLASRLSLSLLVNALRSISEGFMAARYAARAAGAGHHTA